MAERRYTLLFYVALLVAFAATFGVYRVLEATKDSGRIATRAVVVATRDIAEGVTIRRELVGTSDWPVQAVPAAAFVTVDSVAGRVTRIPVFKGEAIVPGRLAPIGTEAGLEIKIGPGKRAMPVRVSELGGVGMIQPNSRVDVLVTFTARGERGDQVAKLFMSNIRVLSVGGQSQRGFGLTESASANTAMLEVTVDEAERLALAMKQGSIQLVLRGYGEPDSVTTKGASAAEVFGRLRGEEPRVEAPRPAVPRTPRRSPAPPRDTTPTLAPIIVQAPQPAPLKPDSFTVQVIRGSQSSQQKFEKPDSMRGRPNTP